MVGVAMVILQLRCCHGDTFVIHDKEMHLSKSF